MSIMAIKQPARLGMRKKERKRSRVEKEQLKQEVIFLAAVTPRQ